MKKIIYILISSIFLFNVSFANELKTPKFAEYDLNENIIKWGWNIDSVKGNIKDGELYTLSRGKFILKCIVEYRTNIETQCELP